MFTITDRPPTVTPSALGALVYPNETAAGLAAAVPQGLLVEALVELTPARLSADGRIDALVAVERHIALLQARSSELLAALETGDITEDHVTRDAVAAALRLPPASMTNRMTSARDLCQRLPATLELLRAGEISQHHTAVIVELTGSLPLESVALVEASVLPRAPRQTAAQFRTSVRKAVLRVTDPVTEDAAHVDAVTQRRVVFIPAADGMTTMWAFLPADSAALIHATLNAMAHKTIHLPGGDDRTADQRRADALVDLARSKLCDTNPTNPAPADHSSNEPSDPHYTDTDPTDTDPTDTGPTGTTQPSPADRTGLARGHGQRPAVQVTIAASTLMGLDDQSCELDGYGPITAAMARRVAADPTATWRRLLTDDHGHVLHASTTGYHPTAGMTATVLARDQHCTFPGCRRASRYNDLDHITAWREGDETTAANLTSLCRRHHRLKHTSAWQVERDDTTGTTTWTDHRGRSYTSRPPDLPTTPTDPTSAELSNRHLERPPRPTKNTALPDLPPF